MPDVLFGFLNNGWVLAMLGASLAVGLACVGSAKGTGLVGEAASGLISEDNSKFGSLLVLQVIPGTQGLYGFVVWFVAALIKIPELLNAQNQVINMDQGAAIFMACLPIALAGMLSAIAQGRVAAAGVTIIAKKPEAQGNSFVMCIVVEFYAIISFLASLLMIFSISPV
ncbi:MAG: V-type ATP synthase subunit K [Oscillospiraceae bacterium]|jgi:V/A-type H+-transporting ATPase subunit K|nr:V-type ATP synthase subunit K [Oscillospiraceae bacterium]